MPSPGDGHTSYTSLTAGPKLPSLPLHTTSPACPWLVSLTCVHTRAAAQGTAGQELMLPLRLLPSRPLRLHRAPGTKRESSARPDTRSPAQLPFICSRLCDFPWLQGSRQRAEFQGGLASPAGVCDLSVDLSCSVLTMHSAARSRSTGREVL